MNRFIDEIETEERTDQKHNVQNGKVFIDTQKLLDVPLPSQKIFISVINNFIVHNRTLVFLFLILKSSCGLIDCFY